MPASGHVNRTSEAMPARTSSAKGPANDCMIRCRRSSIKPSEESTKNAGDPKKMKKPAEMILRPKWVNTRAWPSSCVNVRTNPRAKSRSASAGASFPEMREASRHEDRDERCETRERDQTEQDRHGRQEREPQPASVHGPDEAIGTVPPDPEVPEEPPDLPSSGGRGIEVVAEGGRDVERGGVEEPSLRAARPPATARRRGRGRPLPRGGPRSAPASSGCHP